MEPTSDVTARGTAAEVRSLAEAYPIEQERVRDLLETYKGLRGMPQCNPEFGIMCLEDLLRRADRASAEQNTVEMLRVYEEMKECQ